MPKKKKSSKQLLWQTKGYFLGRYYIHGYDAESLSQVKSRVNIANGTKTKIKLTNAGIDTGEKLGNVFKKKMAPDFTPIENILEVCIDERYDRVVYITNQLGETHAEIVAYQMMNRSDANTLVQLCTDLYRTLDIKPLRQLNFNYTAANGQGTLPPDIHDDRTISNWTLQPDGVATNGRPIIYTQSKSLSDAVNHKVQSSNEFNSWARTLHFPHVPDGVAKQPLRPLRSTSSSGSGKDSLLNSAEAEMMATELRHLKNEVHSLRNQLEDKQVLKEYNTMVRQASRSRERHTKGEGRSRSRRRSNSSEEETDVSNLDLTQGELDAIIRRHGGAVTLTSVNHKPPNIIDLHVQAPEGAEIMQRSEKTIMVNGNQSNGHSTSHLRKAEQTGTHSSLTNGHGAIRTQTNGHNTIQGQMNGHSTIRAQRSISPDSILTDNSLYSKHNIQVVTTRNGQHIPEELIGHNFHPDQNHILYPTYQPSTYSRTAKGALMKKAMEEGMRSHSPLPRKHSPRSQSPTYLIRSASPGPHTPSGVRLARGRTRGNQTVVVQNGRVSPVSFTSTNSGFMNQTKSEIGPSKRQTTFTSNVRSRSNESHIRNKPKERIGAEVIANPRMANYTVVYPTATRGNRAQSASRLEMLRRRDL